MISQQLLKQCKVTQAITVTNGAAGSADIEGVTLDMSGYEGVLMIVQFGAIVSGAVTAITAQQGAASDLSDATNLLGTGQTVADTDDEDTFIIDLYKPRERYVRVHVDRATQNATCSAIYIQYGARTEPVTSASTSIKVESHVSPAEGTA